MVIKKTKSKAKIIAFTQKYCPPCESFKKNVMPKLKKECSVKNIDVMDVSEKVLDNHGIMSTPTFIIEHNGKKKKLVGETGIMEFKKTIERMEK